MPKLMDMFSHGSLFSGIGGFDLAAEWMGWTNIFHCEINPFGQKVLQYYWPNSISYHDIIKTNFTIHRGQIDILTGGFPCQPFSVAGKRKGTADHRNLWPQYFRAIREIQPTWVIGENVPGIISWSAGVVFEQVQADLENEGYQIWPVILPACSVNAPHKRERVWFVAYSASHGHDAKSTEANNTIKNNNQQQRAQRKRAVKRFSNEWITSNANGNGYKLWQFAQNKSEKVKSKSEMQERKRIWSNNWGTCKQGIIANSDNERRQKFNNAGQSKQKGWINCYISPFENWKNFPTQSPVCFGDDGVSFGLDKITFSKWRNESLKAAGNAIVPQVAYKIFSAIEDLYHETNF